MSELIIGEVYLDEINGSYFEVQEGYGYGLYTVFCMNGAWWGTYDHHEKTIFDIGDTLDPEIRHEYHMVKGPKGMSLVNPSERPLDSF